MKLKSFKLRATILITLLITLICVISAVTILSVSKKAVKTSGEQMLKSIVEQNLDEIKYNNGYPDIEEGFLFVSGNITCEVFDFEGKHIKGETPVSGAPYTNFLNAVRSFYYNDENWYLYDLEVHFSRFEYEIDIETHTVVSYEGFANLTDVESVEYPVMNFSDGFSTEKAIDIALSHAGLTRDTARIINAEIPSYSTRQVLSIEFVGTPNHSKTIWIRGVLPANSSEDLFASIYKTVLAVFPIIIILSAAGAYLISKLTIRPVEQISSSAKAISSGNDLTKRISVREGSKEVHTLVETFNDMFERLHVAFESEKRFTSDASHELRTPLSVIKAECEYAMSGKADAADIEEAFVSINQQTDKMTALVSTLLMLTRTENGTMRFKLENNCISNVLQTVCDEFKPSKGITVASNIEPDVFLVCEPVLLSRMLENLMTNAVKYGKENGHVYVRLYRENNKTILTVADDGIGISSEDLPKIFGRFYRSNEIRKTAEGFGLGLALVERIVLLHNGTVTAESVLDIGTKFIITF